MTTLQALLHFSLLDYEEPAEIYSTRGGPSGTVVLNVLPGGQAPGQSLNSHIAWGLYRSVIAFNSPNNIRETMATVLIYGRLVGQVEYCRTWSPLPSDKSLVGDATSVSFASALQLLQGEGDAVVMRAISTPVTDGYSFRWVPATRGAKIRRETAYDTIAYAILWTAQFRDTTRFTGSRHISVPGGRVYVGFASWQIGRWEPLTFGLAATFAKMMPPFLELGVQFQEGFFEYFAPDGELVAKVGIFVSGSIAEGLLSNNAESVTAPEISSVPNAEHVETA